MSKTLQQCKDEVADKLGYPDWWSIDFNKTNLSQEALRDSASELYAESAVREYRERQWIPVSERLPEAGLKVLLMTKFGRFAFGRLNYTYTKGSTYWSACSDGGYSMNNDQCKAEITHWQELPSPPSK